MFHLTGVFVTGPHGGGEMAEQLWTLAVRAEHMSLVHNSYQVAQNHL